MFEAARFPTFDRVVRDFPRCSPDTPGCRLGWDWWTNGTFVPWRDPEEQRSKKWAEEERRKQNM